MLSEQLDSAAVEGAVRQVDQCIVMPVVFFALNPMHSRTLEGLHSVVIGSAPINVHILNIV
jgi:hypothetical protein